MERINRQNLMLKSGKKKVKLNKNKLNNIIELQKDIKVFSRDSQGRGKKEGW